MLNAKFYFGPAFLLTCVLVPVDASMALAASAYQVNQSIVVTDRGESKKFDPPAALLKASSYVIAINKRPAELQQQNNSSGSSTSSNQAAESSTKTVSPVMATPDLGTLIFKAKSEFSAKRYDEAMNLLDQAEGIAPRDAGVKSMKGSLFYVRGMSEQARSKWEESLKLNPNQPSVRSYLQKLGPRPAESQNEPPPETTSEEGETL